jgi:hypothetical protein
LPTLIETLWEIRMESIGVWVSIGLWIFEGYDNVLLRRLRVASLLGKQNTNGEATNRY